MTFIHDDFLLNSKTARRLFHEHAAHLPIIDYHNHLPPADIARDRQFGDLYEAWLEGDHYKWRAMRANGVPERYCTGDAPAEKKFQAWANTVPHTLRNPLYHWTHMELKRYFGIDRLLDGESAAAVWEEANAQLRTPSLSVHGILRRFRVTALCTTDDPADDLSFHRQIAESGLETRVYPAFRPDKALNVHRPDLFNAWADRLSEASDTAIGTLDDFLRALEQRHAFFHSVGCRLSDHGLEHAYADFPSDTEAATVFAAARSGTAADSDQHARFAAHMMLFFGRLNAKAGWTQQLHLGALRNAGSRGYRLLGPDTGFDSIGDFPQAEALAAYLDRLDEENSLPRMVLYNNNPRDNYVFATMAGNFQDGVTPGKVQFGSGWWFLDTREGIEWQLNALSNCGLLSRFIGMLTDSRSFLSFPRHEYFRRVVCDVIGRDIERGEIPDDDGLIGPMIENVCYHNARNYLGLEIPAADLQRG